LPYERPGSRPAGALRARHLDLGSGQHTDDRGCRGDHCERLTGHRHLLVVACPPCGHYSERTVGRRASTSHMGACMRCGDDAERSPARDRCQMTIGRRISRQGGPMSDSRSPECPWGEHHRYMPRSARSASGRIVLWCADQAVQTDVAQLPPASTASTSGASMTSSRIRRPGSGRPSGLRPQPGSTDGDVRGSRITGTMARLVCVRYVA